MSWRTTLKTILIPIVSILLVFVIWDLIIRAFAVDAFVAPSPLDALAAVRDSWSQIWPLTLATIRETVYGFVIGAVLGFVLAVVMAQAKAVQNLIYPILITSQAVPVIALAAPLVILLGFGMGPKIVIVAWIVFFPVAVSVLDGFANVDRDLVNLARVMGGSRWRVFLLIRIPATVTPLFSGLKIGATYAVTGAIIGELVASTGQSLAGFQRTANGNLDTATVWGTTLVMTSIGIGWFLLVVLIEHVATPWRYRATRRRLGFRQPSTPPETNP
jgi:ABC-type nitrate/sulfonate/bicarbonate transport system permease component